MRLWFNIESGIEIRKHTLEVGLYMTQWAVEYHKSNAGVISLRLGPLWIMLFDNVKLMEYYHAEHLRSQD
jgi:hypothetical protein